MTREDEIWLERRGWKIWCDERTRPWKRRHEVREFRYDIPLLARHEAAEHDQRIRIRSAIAGCAIPALLANFCYRKQGEYPRSLGPVYQAWQSRHAAT